MAKVGGAWAIWSRFAAATLSFEEACPNWAGQSLQLFIYCMVQLNIELFESKSQNCEYGQW